jgi:hypothetical protein
MSGWGLFQAITAKVKEAVDTAGKTSQQKAVEKKGMLSAHEAHFAEISLAGDDKAPWDSPETALKPFLNELRDMALAMTSVGPL